MDALFDAERYLCPGMYAAVALLGFSFSLIFWQRCPKACAVAIMACLLDLSANVGDAALNHKLIDIDLFIPLEWALWFFVATHWIAEALVVLAIFLGRDEPGLREVRRESRGPW